ncbi:hypothetical protein BDZ91DRAFT_709671 [Kalaharituber pfeilii]|nr:hypothetical protein BDZ91DRAFT_709671 [Kalaharituber pfeilii]
MSSLSIAAIAFPVSTTTAIATTVYAFCYSTQSAYPKCQNYKQCGPSKGHRGFAEK